MLRTLFVGVSLKGADRRDTIAWPNEWEQKAGKPGLNPGSPSVSPFMTMIQGSVSRRGLAGTLSNIFVSIFYLFRPSLVRILGSRGAPIGLPISNFAPGEGHGVGSSLIRMIMALSGAARLARQTLIHIAKRDISDYTELGNESPFSRGTPWRLHRLSRLPFRLHKNGRTCSRKYSRPRVDGARTNISF